MQGQDATPATRNLVFIDGHCRQCRLAGSWLERLDLRGSLGVQSFRHDYSYLQYGITAEALEQDMHLVRGTQVFRGFAAVTELSRQLPLLWPLFPFFLLAGRAGLGARLYSWLAVRRLIVADATSCRPALHSATSCRSSAEPD